MAETRTIEALEAPLRRLLRWASLPRFRERFAARSGVALDRASYSLILPLDDGPLRISTLAERSGVDVSTASRQVVQLEAEGFLTRVPDPDDARAAILELTRAGRRQLAKIAAARREILAEALDDFSEAEIRQFGDFLDRFTQNLARVLDDDRSAARRAASTSRER